MLTAEQLKRAKSANLVFELHAAVNKIIGSAAFRIMEGDDAKRAAQVMVSEILIATDACASRIIEDKS